MINWIPTEDRLPTFYGLYLVTVKTYDTSKEVVGVSTHTTNWYRDRWTNFNDEDVTAWAEMPEPYDENKRQTSLFDVLEAEAKLP